MKSCSIKGLGYALAKRRVTNEELSAPLSIRMTNGYPAERESVPDMFGRREYE
ncbi:MAG: hypothetical protein ACLT16_12060 [[Clostridium] innocuum]